MFEFSFPELVVVCVIALLVLGPDKLPSALRTLGLWVGRISRTFTTMKTEIEREIGMDEIRRQLHNEAVMDQIKRLERDVRGEAGNGAKTTPMPDRLPWQRRRIRLPQQIPRRRRPTLDPAPDDDGKSVDRNCPHPPMSMTFEWTPTSGRFSITSSSCANVFSKRCSPCCCCFFRSTISPTTSIRGSPRR